MNSVGCQLAIGRVLSYIFITWLLASNEGVVDKLLRFTNKFSNLVSEITMLSNIVEHTIALLFTLT